MLFSKVDDETHYTILKGEHLSGLFHQLLYSDQWNMLDRDWRPWVFDAIKSIYFFGGTSSSWLSTETKYMLYQQYRPSYPYTLQVQPDRVVEELLLPIQEKLIAKNKYFDDKGLPPDFRTYEGVVQAAESANLDLPITEFYSFPSPYDMAMWIFERIIKFKKNIYICKQCHQYYVPARTDAQYCSDSCREAANQTRRFCSIPELKKKYSRILTFFSRKEKSNRSYIYDETPACFSDTFDKNQLLSPIIQSAGDALSYEYTAQDFRAIHDAFLSKNTTKRERFQTTYQQYMDKQISEDSYLTELQSYLEWLEDVHTQLSFFKPY